jgi:DNA-binding protein
VAAYSGKYWSGYPCRGKCYIKELLIIYMAHMNTETTPKTEDNVIFVGNKPVMNYVLAAVTQFNEGAKEVSIKARGRAISRAVDTAEVVRNRFLLDVVVDHIKISTEELTSEKGDNINVSSIEIFLKRP